MSGIIKQRQKKKVPADGQKSTFETNSGNKIIKCISSKVNKCDFRGNERA